MRWSNFKYMIRMHAEDIFIQWSTGERSLSKVSNDKREIQEREWCYKEKYQFSFGYLYSFEFMPI